MMSILSRKCDLIYLVFFTIHIPVLFCVDLATLYPESFKPAFIVKLHEYQITTYADRFFTEPPAWFGVYIWMEAIYHVPLSFWAVGGLLRNDPKVPLHLLVYAVQTAITTTTCIADFLSWSDYQSAQKLELASLYVPYLALSVFMGIDMFGRLSSSIDFRRLKLEKSQ